MSSEKNLSDLKITVLRAELEKRGLEKSGLKSVLVERLRNALEEDEADEKEFVGRCLKGVKGKNEEEEPMDTSESNVREIPEKSVNDDDDTPCSEEELDDCKHKEDTESARFRTSTQLRRKTPTTGNETAAATEDTGIEVNENKVDTSEADGTEVAESNDDAKSGKGKVLKVIGKDKVQQFALTARTLWVTGLVSTSKVSDLKNLFSKHGKVTSAKIVRSTKGTQRKWYGLLTMATSKDASKCIQKLHRTEFGGHVISVERRQTAPVVKKSESAVVKKQVVKGDVKNATAAKPDHDYKKVQAASDDKKEPDSGEAGEEKEKSTERESAERDYRRYESKSYFRSRYGRVPFRRPFGSFRGRMSSFRGRGSFRRPFGRPHFDRPGFRPFSRGYRFEFGSRGRGGHLSHRDYLREREIRMKRDEEMFRHKMIERKQKEEAYRLEREKSQLRYEREMLEREKAEMIKLERAKQRMERENIDAEREKRQPPIGHPSKRPFNRRGGGPPVWMDRRRDSEYNGASSNFHREKFGDSKFPYSREHSAYKKPEFSHDFRREKMDAPLPHAKFVSREEKREVTYHGRPERRVYSRSEFGNPEPGPSSSGHFVPRSKPREDWKFDNRRGGKRPTYAPRGGPHKRMDYY